MDAMEIMTNEEVNGVTTEIVKGGFNTKALKIAGGVGLVGLVGFGIYKGIKHFSAKRKAKKELLEAADEAYDEDFEDDDLEDDDVENDED